MISQRRLTYANHIDFDSVTFFIRLSILNILNGSLQPKLKGANVWPSNARGKVARGSVYHIWSLYWYCKEKIDQTQLQWYPGQFLHALAGPVFRLDLPLPCPHRWWQPPVKCGCAGLRMFKRVNCGEILRGLSADVMGKMQRCGYVITLSSRISRFLLLLQYLEKGLHVPTSSSP